MLPMEKGAFYGIKNDRTDKKFGSKTAVDNLDITLTMVSTAYWVQMAQGKQRLCVCSAISKSYFRENSAERENIVGLGERYRNLLGYLPQHFGYYPDFQRLTSCSMFLP